MLVLKWYAYHFGILSETKKDFEYKIYIFLFFKLAYFGIITTPTLKWYAYHFALLDETKKDFEWKVCFRFFLSWSILDF